MTEPTGKPAKSLGERIADRLSTINFVKKRTALRQVIESRHVLFEMRQNGLSSAALVELLSAEGLSIAAGTLRNYCALVERAIAQLAQEGITAPDDDAIQTTVNQLMKPDAASATPAPGPRERPVSASSARPAPPARPSTPGGISLLNDPNRDV